MQRVWLQPPASGEPRAWTPPAVETFALSNGMQVYFVQSPGPQVVVRYYIRQASEGVISDRPGTASSTAAMLIRGSHTHPRDRLRASARSIAVELTTDVDASQTMLQALGAPSEFANATGLLAEAVTDPEFAPEEFSVVHRMARESRQSELQNSSFFSFRMLYFHIFGERHRLGLPLRGTEQDISRLQLSDVVAFYRQRYVPAASALVVVGPLELAQVRTIAERTFGTWSASTPAYEPTEQNTRPSTPPQHLHYLPLPNSSLTGIFVGFRGPSNLDNDAMKIILLNLILGGLPSSRLAQTLRNQEGYSYAPTSYNSMTHIGGLLGIQLYVANANMDAALLRGLHELAVLQQAPPSDEELNRAKSVAEQGFIHGLCSPIGIADTVAGIAVDGLPLTYMNNYRAQLRAVTPGQIQFVAQQYLDRENIVVVITGNQSDAQIQALERLGLGHVVTYQPLRL